MKRTFAVVFVIGVLGCVAAAAQAPPREATLAQQKMCAEQAKTYFTDFWSHVVDNNRSETGTLLSPNYVDHYDVKANVCYVGIEWFFLLNVTGGSQVLMRNIAVYDAFERTHYAGYVSEFSEKSGKKVTCNVEPPGRDTVTCESEAEFNESIKKYFGLVFR